MTDVESLTVPPAGRALQEMRPPGDNTANQSDEKTNSSTSAATAFLSSFLKPHSSLKEQIASDLGSKTWTTKRSVPHAPRWRFQTRRAQNEGTSRRTQEAGKSWASNSHDKEAFDLEMLERRALKLVKLRLQKTWATSCQPRKREDRART